MTAGRWHLGPMCAFDIESTGVNVETDRVVTVTVAHVNDGPTRAASYLINPGIDIPPAASAVHGISTEHAREHGHPPGEVLDVVAAELALTLRHGTPVVTMNGVYDFTLLDRDCTRHGVPTVTERLDDAPLAPVIDVRVLDKKVDRYRKGGRKLTDLCKTYQVRIDGAHDATEDALAAARVAWRIAQRNPEIAAMDPLVLHRMQVQWAAEQTASFAAYRRALGNPLEDEDGTWPIRPAKPTTANQGREAA